LGILQSLPERQHRHRRRRSGVAHLLAAVAGQADKNRSGANDRAASTLEEEGADRLSPRTLLFPSPPRQPGRSREADKDETDLHSVLRTSTRVEELPLPLPPHLTDTSTSLPSSPWPARGKDEAAETELKKKKPAANTLFKDAVANTTVHCFHWRSQGRRP
jgi:hypothetical protein